MKRAWVGCEPWRFDGRRWVSGDGGVRRQIQSYRDLDVFNLAYTLAMEVFQLTTQATCLGALITTKTGTQRPKGPGSTQRVPDRFAQIISV